jgi:hypothetical protein
MKRSRLFLLASALGLAACGAPAAAPQPASAPPPSSAAALAPADLQGLREDVARFVRPTNAERVEALRSLLQERGIPFEVQPFPNPRQSADTRAEGHNVIVSLGSGAREIVVGAHFDAVRLPDGRLSHGVVDNAAGTVVLARLAEALRQRPLNHSVRIVFFDMEEIGLVGSRHYVQTLDRARVAAMVNLDIAGYGDTVIFGPAAHPGNEAVYSAMWQVCAHRGFGCVEFPQYPPSDDRSFQAAGIPNISLAVLPRVEAHQLWLLLNAGPESGLREGFTPAIVRTIHTAEDTLDKLDPEGMSLALDAVLNLLLQLDTARKAPVPPLR